MGLLLPSAALLALASSGPPDGTAARVHFDVGRLRGRAFGYDIVMPNAPTRDLPVLFFPQHPTDLDPAFLRLPQDSGPWAVVLVDGWNLLYVDRSASSYERLTHHDRLRARVRELQLRALRDAQRRLPLDTDRVVCYGISASGNSCWDLALRWPHTFAGVWPISAGFVPMLNDPCLPNLEGQHFYVLDGTEDDLIRRADVQLAVERARDAGADVAYVLVEGAPHGTFDDAIWAAGLHWASQQSRPAGSQSRPAHCGK